MSEGRVLFVTAPDRERALEIARALVDEKLAACVNLLGEIRSVYRWQGQVVDEPEVLCLIKTTADRVEALTARVVELHPYEVPEVIALPIDGGHGPYLAWLSESVRP